MRLTPCMSLGTGAPAVSRNVGAKSRFSTMSLLTVPGLVAAGPADKQRRAQALFVHEPLVVPAMVAEEEALIGGVDDDGVIGEFFLVEVVEHAADVIVH